MALKGRYKWEVCFKIILQGQFAQLVHWGAQRDSLLHITVKYEGAFLSLLNLPRYLAQIFTCFNVYRILQGGNFARMNYTHKIVGTHRAALLPKGTSGAKPLLYVGLKSLLYQLSKSF